MLDYGVRKTETMYLGRCFATSIIEFMSDYRNGNLQCWISMWRDAIEASCITFFVLLWLGHLLPSACLSVQIAIKKWQPSNNNFQVLPHKAARSSPSPCGRRKFDLKHASVYLFKIYLILGTQKKECLKSPLAGIYYLLYLDGYVISIHIRPLYYFWLADKLRRRRWRWFCGLMKSIDDWRGPLSFQCAYKGKIRSKAWAK